MDMQALATAVATPVDMATTAQAMDLAPALARTHQALAA